MVNMKPRLNIATEYLIELGPGLSDKIYIRSTSLNDRVSWSFGDMTKEGTDFSGITSIRWGIYLNGNSMNKESGMFDYEPMPSSRTDKFLEEHRYSSYEEALETYLKFHGEVNPFQRKIDIQLEFERNNKKELGE